MSTCPFGLRWREGAEARSRAAAAAAAVSAAGGEGDESRAQRDSTRARARSIGRRVGSCCCRLFSTGVSRVSRMAQRIPGFFSSRVSESFRVFFACSGCCFVLVLGSEGLDVDLYTNLQSELL